jgi:RNA polymerase sigma-70 factor (ECF subfamily)
MMASRPQTRGLARRRTADPAPPDREGAGEAAEGRPRLETIYREHADSVATWTRRLGGPDLDVEDTVHEVFLVVHRRLPEWRGDAKISTWLYEITFRIVQQRRRWRWPRLGLRRSEAASREDLTQIATSEPDALALLERREANAALYELLDGIGEKYRTVIILFELEGLRGEEIAALTRTSLGNVWIRLHRARQKLMKRFLAWEAKR